MKTESIGQSYIDFYDCSYKGTVVNRWREITARMKVDHILELCSGISHQSILEIGAGEGAVLARLAELHFGDEYHALEISKNAIEAIKKRNIPNLQNASAYDGYHISYEDQRFDLGILTHVIEHVEYPRLLLYEVARVSKKVFIEAPLEHTLNFARDFHPDSAGHINFYDNKTIRSLVQTCNLKVLSQIVRNPSRASYLYRDPRLGGLKYWVKQILLMGAPKFAQMIWTYHCALLSEREEGPLTMITKGLIPDD